MKKEFLSAIGVLLVAGLLLLLVLLPSETTPPDTTGATPPTGSTTVPTTIPGTAAAPETTTTPGTTTPQPSTAMPTEPVPGATTVPTAPGATTVPTAPGTTVLPAPTTQPPAPAVVRLYTCDPALLAVYVELAGEYYASTGTEVIVQTPQEGQTCEEALTALLAGDNAPTVFCIHTEQMLQQLQHGLYDLSGTYIASQLYGDAFALTVDGKVLGLAADVAGSGLIYNASKLASAAWTDEDLVDFDVLSVAVASITTNKGYAFAAPNFTDTHLMEHLAGLYANADQLRSFVDLYFKNCTSKASTLNYFLNGTTVFYIGGTRDYEKVAALGAANLRFLPAYAKDSTRVQCFSDHYWAVNANARQADIEAAVAFLDWLVKPQNNALPVDRLGMLSPYRGATFCGNVLEEKLRAYIVDGNACVAWTVSGNVSDLDAFIAALQAYKTSATDKNWAAVAATLGE